MSSTTPGTSNLHAHCDTAQHGASNNIPSQPQPQPHSTLSSRARHALHRCYLSLSTPQAATTSANRKRDAPSPRSSIRSCRALPPLPTYIDSERARCKSDLCLTHKHRLCRPQSVSLLFLFSSFSSYQATTSSVLAPTAILTVCFKQRANASILSRPILQPRPLS